jgi:phage-related minor tail protein
LKQGQSLFENFGNAVMNVFDKILNKMLDFATEAAFGGGSGAGGGFLGSLLGAVSGIFGGGNALGSGGGMNMTGFSGALIPHAKGGVIGSPMMFDMAGGKTGVAGEADMEGILPLQRGPDGSLGVQMYGGGGASGAPVNNVEVNNHYHLTGAISSEDVQKMVRGAAEQSAVQTRQAVRRELPSWLDEYSQNGALV